MTMDPRAVAEMLAKARQARSPLPPLTETHPDMTAADAYAVQSELVDMQLGEGDRIVGYKLGLTSEPMQKLLGVDEPDYAPIFASGLVDDGGTVDLGEYIAPKFEAEIALTLRSPLTGPGVTEADAARAVGGAAAAIEIVDSRIRDWKIKLADTVADLASSGSVVLSSRVVPIEDFDVRLLGMVVSRNGRMVATGAGAAAMGSPIATVAWLANTLAPYGVTLEAGRFVMTGALHAAFTAEPGDVVRAEFDRLGPVSVAVV